MFKKYLSITLPVLFLFVLDRLAKLWFVKNPDFFKEAVAGFLKFQLEKNFGVAFGLPLNKTLTVILTVIIIIILISILLKLYYKKNVWLVFSLSLIILGAGSNLIDRLKYGFVVDYINVPFFTVFNLADVMISLGVILVISQELFSQTRHQQS